MSVTIPTTEIDVVAQHYIVALRWSETNYQPDEDEPEIMVDQPFDAIDAELTDEAIETITAEVQAFLIANFADVSEFMALGHGFEQVGHDLALTRNGHGAGFWDRGAGAVGERLTEAARAIGEQHLILGDDGDVHVM